MQPDLLKDSFGRLQFQRRIMDEDVGEGVLYRDYYMTGWYGRVGLVVFSLQSS